jgi:hypothetical protein
MICPVNNIPVIIRVFNHFVNGLFLPLWTGYDGPQINADYGVRVARTYGIYARDGV